MDAGRGGGPRLDQVPVALICETNFSKLNPFWVFWESAPEWIPLLSLTNNYSLVWDQEVIGIIDGHIIIIIQ